MFLILAHIRGRSEPLFRGTLLTAQLGESKKMKTTTAEAAERLEMQFKCLRMPSNASKAFKWKADVRQGASLAALESELSCACVALWLRLLGFWEDTVVKGKFRVHMISVPEQSQLQ